MIKNVISSPTGDGRTEPLDLIGRYDRDGYFVVPDVFSCSEVRELAAESLTSWKCCTENRRSCSRTNLS